MTAPVPERWVRLAMEQFDGEWMGLDAEVRTVLAPVLADLRAQVQALPTRGTVLRMGVLFESVGRAEVLALLGGGDR